MVTVRLELMEVAGQAEHGQAGLDLAALLRDLGDRDELNGPSLCGRIHGSRVPEGGGSARGAARVATGVQLGCSSSGHGAPTALATAPIVFMLVLWVVAAMLNLST